jgi:O-antigen/teichoic acid export membrane protein
MKELSRFYSSLGLLIFLNAVVKPVWIFGIDRQVQNAVGASVYGSYFSILNLSIVFSFLLDWGLTNFYNRQLAAKNESFIAYAGSFIVLKLLFALLYGGIICCITLLSGIDKWNIVLYVILIQVCTSFLVFFRAIITSQQWFTTDAWLSVLDKIAMILLCGTLIWFPFLAGPINIERFLLLQTACTALAIIIALGILLRRRFYFSFKKIWPGRRVFKAAIPFAIIILLMSFHSRVDGFLLERISNAEEAGKYAAAYRLLDASNMIGYLFASFLLPFIARNWNDRKNMNTVVLNVRHLLLIFSITISCIVIVLAPWIQMILYHHDDPGSVEVLQWCLPALIGYSLVQVYGTVMTATGHIVAFSYITLIAVVINMSLNILFIRSMGAKASCLAALVSQFFCGIATLVYVKQKLNIPVDLRSVLIYIFIAAAIYGFLYVCNDLPVNKWLVMGGTGIIALTMLWITKLLDLNSWKISSGTSINS